VTQGGCLAIAPAKGNCQACHAITGIASGNVAAPLAGVSQRIPDRARLRAQIENPLQFNARSVMPPYGSHEILTPAEIDKVLAWLDTL
jgi:sulfur-oxidizing protein SoxX